MKSKLTLSIICAVLFFTGCRKNLEQQNELAGAPAAPTVRTDKFFKNGVLVFKSPEDIKRYWGDARKDVHLMRALAPGFRTLQDTFDEFHNKAKSDVKTNDIYNLEQVPQSEFIYDQNTTTLPDPALAGILNPDLQVVVDNTLFQLTRIGVFRVDLNNIQNFTDVMTANINSITYDPGFLSVPGETPIGGGEYQVAPGVVRVTGLLDIFRAVPYVDDNGGYTGSAPGGAPGGGVPDYYVNVALNSSSFNKEVAIGFNDFTKRRLVFDCNQTDIPLFFFSFHTIGTSGKIQREKKFLWFTYWGESYADELHVGCDNMYLETDYIFPHPQQFSVMQRPEVASWANFEIGNHLLQVMHINVNLSALGFSLTNSQISSFIDGQFNSLVGGVYTNIFEDIEKRVLNSIDPSYISTYANYTKRLNALKNDYKLKWVMGKTEKLGVYASSNTWDIDTNFGGTYSYGGVPPGGYPAQYNYRYDMKGGSFFVRAKTYGVWRGIRVVKF